MLAPFIVSAADGRFDCPLYGAQDFAADVADCGTECVDSVRGGKIVDSLKTVFVKIAIRFKSAPFQQRVSDADCGGRLELHFQPGTIIVHQERTVNDGADIFTVVVPIICDQLSGNIGKLLTDPFMADAVCGSQRMLALISSSMTSPSDNPGYILWKNSALVDIVAPQSIGLLFSARHFNTNWMWSAFSFIKRLRTTSAGLSSPAMCRVLRLVVQVSTSKSTI